MTFQRVRQILEPWTSYRRFEHSFDSFYEATMGPTGDFEDQFSRQLALARFCEFTEELEEIDGLLREFDPAGDLQLPQMLPPIGSPSQAMLADLAARVRELRRDLDGRLKPCENASEAPFTQELEEIDGHIREVDPAGDLQLPQMLPPSGSPIQAMLADLAARVQELRSDLDGRLKPSENTSEAAQVPQLTKLAEAIAVLFQYREMSITDIG